MRRRDCLKMATAGSMSMLGLTGCLSLIEGEGEDNTTQTPGDQVSDAPSTESKREVPTVTNPLDTSALKDDICSALTSEQLQKLNLQPGESVSSKGRPGCKHEYTDDFSSQIAIQIAKELENGLAGIYAREPKLSDFREIEIEGYPAVFAHAYNDGGERGFCQLYVALADTFLIRVIAQSGAVGSDYDSPCAIAELVAKIVVRNLKTTSTEPTDSQLPSITRSESKHEVPTVTNPLDVSTLKKEPCTVFSSEQLQKLGLTFDERGSTPLGNYCTYDYTDGSPSYVGIAVLKRFKNGLTDVYAREAESDYFKPTNISGYPAAYSMPGDVLDSKKSECRLYVGLTDSFVVVLYTNLYSSTNDYGRPCDVAKMTAETMIQGLQNGS